ncbi:hypothetical protein [Vibrio sp. Vb0301]|uniref:hypothetical protein n=1 Tax=Vibrio sp. Vb0301 TaxID=3074622 RepID=UPI0029646858|nr:hypothetical protein [Vibrio sp. Vb0301]MDW2011454.1 hypothetical protein [Vibrio sp. Vb0301]
MIHDVVTKHVGTQAAIFLTNEHLHLFINNEGYEYYVDLMQNEHKFLVRDFEGLPVAAWYCAEENIPVDLEVIKFLSSSGFIYSKTEAGGSDYTLNVNMPETCKELTEESLVTGE